MKSRHPNLFVLTFAVVLLALLLQSTPGALAQNGAGKDLWQSVTGTPPPAKSGAQPDVQPQHFTGFRLNPAGMSRLLARAPLERTQAARQGDLVMSLPNPQGKFESFAVEEAPIMEPGLAAKHPDIKTYRGRGIDDKAATIRMDMTPLGFHASVRSPKGAWYIDPYYHLDTSFYVSYFGRDLTKDPHGAFVERDADSAELSVDKGFYHAADSVGLQGSGFAANTVITITISDPEEKFAERSVKANSDELGNFQAAFVADPDGNLDTHIVEATDGTASAFGSYQVVRDDDPTKDPPTGDVLRTYRLALITDPGYAAFFGGSANVTPAKVTLMNRVDQLYEDDMSITMVLVNNNDLLNLDTWAQATEPNGPCGSAACFTQSQVTGCSSTSRARYVIGQIIGASNYDIGHLGLGQPGGGVANLGVVGRSNKAGGCTGIPTPVGDYYAVDYVAHEMGHQFSGNHPFNGNQLNCSGGNRSAANSDEPGSGSSVMAYAGICLTDDLQAHSDPYFSQHSQQEISTYTSSDQAAINEIQTVSLRHFGGGNEVQVVTFGPGYSQAATIQPLTVAINAAPSASSLGGAQESGNTVTIAMGSAHTLQVGDSVTIAGVGVAGYNGTWTVTAVPTSRSFQYTNPTAGLAISGGGTVTLNAPGLTESGNTVTVSTAAAHGRAVGDIVTIAVGSGGVTGYNGTYTITAVPTPRTFEYTNPTAGLANSGGGSATYYSPFQVRIGGNDSAVIGGAGQAYNATNIQTAINAIAGFAGTVSVPSAGSTGFTVTYGGATANTDMPNFELVNLSCGGCFAAVDETNHGGAFDSFTLNYNGSVSAPIVNGTNYSSAGIVAALAPILPSGATATVAPFGGGGGNPNNTGFMVTFGGTLAATNLSVMLAVQDMSTGMSAWTGETDKGGAVDNKGGTITPTGDNVPVVTAPAQYTIPLRTPFVLTGSGTDADNDALLYSWEQNDRGASPNSAGVSLLNNVKPNGPLFAMFPKSGQISTSDSLQYNSPGENHLTADPTRVFPDLQQIIDNNTNADTGACAGGVIAQPVPQSVTECFAEFLPTSDYVGYSTTGFNNASPLSLHFRLTARDGRGGTSSADTTLLLASGTGPFLVTSPNTAVSYTGGSTQTVTWDVAGTDAAPISAANVKISLSTDGGHTYPTVLAASTPNDGSESVTLPNVATTHARVKIEAVGNVFFDISNADFSLQAVPVVTNSLNGGSQAVQYSDSLKPDVTVTATDADSLGINLTAQATGLPQGMSLAVTNTSDDTTLPGTRSWKVAGATTAAPGSYPVTVTVSDETGGQGTTSFTIVVKPEDAVATYTGDMLVFSLSGGQSANVVLRAAVVDSSAVPSFSDSEAGDVSHADLTFKEGSATLCGPVTVELKDSALSGVGSCTVSLRLGAHKVDVYVGNYYVGTTLGVVEVSAPDGSFATGGGFRTIGKSGGTYKADAGSRMDFGFYVNARSLKNPQNNVVVVFRRGGHIYEIKGLAISSLGLRSALKTSEFRARANLIDVTNPLAPTTVARNLILQVALTDKGDPGTSDTIAFTLRQGTRLIFSSEWTGRKTLEEPLEGGDLVVR